MAAVVKLSLQKCTFCLFVKIPPLKECLERSIRLDHRFAYAYSLLGHELIDMNDFGRAAQAFRKAVQFSPNDYRAWYGLGLVNFKVNQKKVTNFSIFPLDSQILFKILQFLRRMSELLPPPPPSPLGGV